MKNFFSTLYFAYRSRLFATKEFFRVAWRYWRDKEYARIDISLLRSYFWKSPYRIARERSGVPYGETPLSTLGSIAKECEITVRDSVLELGAGRGRGLFWLAHFIGCPVRGVEIIPEFVSRARAIQEKFKIPHVTISCADMLEADFAGSNYIYLFGSNLEDDDLVHLTEKMETLAAGTKIITISFPLSEYGKKEKFHLIKSFEVEFPWGKSDCFLQEII